MRRAVKHPLLALVLFLVVLGVVELLMVLFFAPGRDDLLTLTGFMALFGGLTIALSFAIGRTHLPSWIRSIRTQLLLISLAVAVLVAVNIGFVAYLMFISPHDLGLLVGLIVFSLGLSAIFGFFLSRTTVDNLHQLISAVRQVNSGDLVAVVPVSSHDEVGELAASFNAMVQRLQQSLGREREMEKSRRELIEAVSHDLRTPISSIRAMIESINDGVVTDEATVKRYLRVSQAEIENLSQLVNDLFELSQIDAGLLRLHVDAVQLQELIPDTVATMSAQAASRHLKLQEEVDDTLPPVLIDGRMVQRVLYNLVQNAIRHTPPDGTIRVSARDAGDIVEVRVADTGEGIPTEDLTRVFERSYSRDQARSRQSGGTGLGLSISRGIVEAHGGNISVASLPGQGSVFSFTLPKAAAG